MAVKKTPKAKAKERPTLGEISIVTSPMFSMSKMPAFNPSGLVSRKGMAIFDQMRVDDQIKAAMSFKKFSILSTGWEIVSPKNQPEDWGVTKFVQKQFEEIEGSFVDSLTEILTALDFGFSVTEKVFDQISSGEFAGLIGLRALKTRRPHNISFAMDEHGNLLSDGIIQFGGLKGQVRLPRDKFVVYTYQFEFGNWYGKSDLEAAYRDWWLKENTYRWLAMLLERFGIPPIFALYNPEGQDADQIRDLLKAIESLQAATSGAIPRLSKDDLELWAPEIAGQASRVFIPALDLFNRGIARALLMPGLLGITPDQAVGSFARARVVFDAFMMTITKIRNQCEDSVVTDQILRPLVDLNYDVQEYPMFRFLPITDDTRMDLMKQWSDFVDKGVVKPQADDEEHIRNLFRFPHIDTSSRDVDGEGPSDDEDEGGEEGGPFSYEDLDGKSEDKDGEDNAKYYRAKTKFEKEVDFKQIETDLDELERRALEQIVPALVNVRDRFLKFVERKFDHDARFIRDLKEFRGMPEVGKEISQFVLNAYNLGSKTMAKELKVSQQAAIKTNAENLYDQDVHPHQETPGFRPRDAERYLRAKTFWITGVIDDRLREKSRGIMLRSIQTGEHINTTMQKLKEGFEPYVGDPTKIRSGVVVRPSRLETIVRTNATDAFNQGRIVEARRAGEFLTGFQYSAILDKVTTEVCAHLDGKIFRKDDPLVDELRPPRHMNCRSTLVAITIDEPVKEEEFIKPSEAGKGLELSGEDFGGPPRATGLRGAK